MDTGPRVLILFIVLIRARTRAEDARNLRLFQESLDVRRNRISYAGIRCAHDIALTQRIPEGDVVTPHHRGLLLDTFGQCLRQHCRHNPPETILRMSVVELHFPRLRRRNRAQHQHLRIRIIQRSERTVIHMCQLRHPSLLSPDPSFSFVIYTRPKDRCLLLPAYCSTILNAL